MGYRVSAQPIHRGKVIEYTYVHHDIAGDNVTAEQIGSVVMATIANARAMGWHMADPEVWIRIEIRQFQND